MFEESLLFLEDGLLFCGGFGIGDTGDFCLAGGLDLGIRVFLLIWVVVGRIVLEKEGKTKTKERHWQPAWKQDAAIR